MQLFFISFFSIYALMHLYFFIKLRRAFIVNRLTASMIVINLILLWIAPIIARFAVRKMMMSWAFLFTYVAYCWLAFLFLFCCAAAVQDIIRFLQTVSRRLMRKRKLPSSRKSRKPTRSVFFIPTILSLIICIYGYFEAQDIRVETITVTSPKITEPIRIVQISDLHLGITVRENHLKKVLDLVQTAQPDLLAATGDLIDADDGFLDGMDQQFRKIRPRLGKYAVLGNHEFLWGSENACSFLQQSGFRILRNEGVEINKQLLIAGVDDPQGIRDRITTSERNLLKNIPHNQFVLFLKHRPLIDRNSIGLFDLQLSGHTHKGQIFPLSIATWLYYPQHAGLLHISSGAHKSTLYVNRGCGTWGPPIRFLAHPEVTIIDLKPSHAE
jgi:predicted MPP superfamily phosphohydrolase